MKQEVSAGTVVQVGMHAARMHSSQLIPVQERDLSVQGHPLIAGHQPWRDGRT